jgi:sn1-specific diacylglycerol lipase
MFIGGKVLHIVRRKKSEVDKKNRIPSTFEMRWAQPEDLMELKSE